MGALCRAARSEAGRVGRPSQPSPEMHQFAPWSSDRAGPETGDVRRFGVMKDEIRRSATKLIICLY
jgi:hypothetical protein